MLPRVYVSAEDDARALLNDHLGKFRGTEMLGIHLKGTVDIASGDVRRRMSDKHIYPRGNLREPADERIGVALERP